MVVNVQDIVDALTAAKSRLTGSRARGEERADSDFDFYVPERRWKRFVKEAPGGWESCTVGHIGWWTDVGLIEASDMFRRTPKAKRLESAEALGATWGTW